MLELFVREERHGQLTSKKDFTDKHPGIKKNHILINQNNLLYKGSE